MQAGEERHTAQDRRQQTGRGAKAKHRLATDTRASARATRDRAPLQRKQAKRRQRNKREGKGNTTTTRIQETRTRTTASGGQAGPPHKGGRTNDKGTAGREGRLNETRRRERRKEYKTPGAKEGKKAKNDTKHAVKNTNETKRRARDQPGKTQ